jgi:hypothetical protein
MEERSQDGPEGLKSFPRRQNSPPQGPHFFNPPANRRYPECSCKNPGYATGSLFGAVEVREYTIRAWPTPPRHRPSRGGRRVLVARDHRREHRRDVSIHLVSHDLEGIRWQTVRTRPALST